MNEYGYRGCGVAEFNEQNGQMATLLLIFTPFITFKTLLSWLLHAE